MPEELDPNLEPLRPLLGRTFKGEITEDDGRVSVDVSRWERALNGRAVRNVHSLNDGEYGGETIIYWDRATETVAAWYFTTSGFWTRATMRFEDGKVISREQVSGSKTGITEVRSTAELMPDGSLETRAEYLRNGEWVPGHAGLYREDSSAEVRFR